MTNDEFTTMMHFIAQGAINVDEGHTTILRNSPIYKAWHALCKAVTEGHVALVKHADDGTHPALIHLTTARNSLDDASRARRGDRLPREEGRVAMSKIKIGLACPYCFSSVIFETGPIELRRGDRLAREGDVATVKCPHCDSKFTVALKTKRKTKGARMHAKEAAAKKAHDEKYAAAQERNNAIGVALLAQPGCTCAASIANDGKYGRGMHGDHPLVSSWTYNMPNEPRHRHQCPLRGSVEEAALLDSFAHNAKTGAA